MQILISSLMVKEPLDPELKSLMEKAALAVLEMEGCQDGTEVSILLTDDAYIHELNKQYRGVDKPTDVLSFALDEGQAMPDPGEERLLGDVVISLQAALRQGKEYGHGLERELAYLVAHGVLHLLGYDHINEDDKAVMREKEEAAMNRLGLNIGL